MCNEQYLGYHRANNLDCGVMFTHTAVSLSVIVCLLHIVFRYTVVSCLRKSVESSTYEAL